jgi:hypothetical protein
VEASRPLATSCPVSAKLDGGKILEFVCPDFEPLARYGRLACSGYGIVGADAGTGAALKTDGGSRDAVVRTECWGPNMSSTP